MRIAPRKRTRPTTPPGRKRDKLAKEYFVSNIREWAGGLSAGEEILLTGEVYTARDAAHKRFAALTAEGKALPFPLRDAVIYYAGPTPAQRGLPVGSFGPTTSSRMDPYAPALLDAGLAGMIGKGPRSPAVVDAIKRNGAVYLCAVGGAGALAARCVKSLEVVAFDDLGCESVKRVVFERFPLYVGIDAKPGSRSLFG